MELAGEIGERLAESRTQKALYERRWEICLRFLRNDQHNNGYDAVTQGYRFGSRMQTKHIAAVQVHLVPAFD